MSVSETRMRDITSAVAEALKQGPKTVDQLWHKIPNVTEENIQAAIMELNNKDRLEQRGDYYKLIK